MVSFCICSKVMDLRRNLLFLMFFPDFLNEKYFLLVDTNMIPSSHFLVQAKNKEQQINSHLHDLVPFLLSYVILKYSFLYKVGGFLHSATVIYYIPWLRYLQMVYFNSKYSSISEMWSIYSKKLSSQDNRLCCLYTASFCSSGAIQQIFGKSWTVLWNRKKKMFS